MSTVDKRIIRRETHSPRSVAAITVASAMIVVIAWLAVEGVVSLLGNAPLLATPRQILTVIATAPTASAGALGVTAVLCLLVGLVLLMLAVFPGRRSRRRASSRTAIIVVNDELLASAVARKVARAAGVSPDAVVVSLGRRSGTIRIRPVSGISIDRDEIQKVAQAEFELAETGARLHFTVTVTNQGVVGS